MNKFFETISTEKALTQNGALTNSTSLNPILDLFFLAGACRKESEKNIIAKIQQAYSFDKDKTLKVIFWAGDIREGAGERRFFRIALKFLDNNYPDDLDKLIGFVPFYNRWDSLFDLNNEKVLDLVKSALEQKDALCAKWLPREHSKKFTKFRLSLQKKFKLKSKFYRKLIVELSKTVEQQMSKCDWANIIYKQVPSGAMNKYRKTFYRNDKERFEGYINKVKTGEEKINAKAILPYDIYRAYKRGDNQSAIEAQWNALPNYMETSNEMILPVCDVSGSMVGLPMDISISLGIYISERNKSCFKNGFITFSDFPKLQILNGSLCQRIRQLEAAHWSATTDLQKVFDLILQRAILRKLSQEEMPTKLLIISDMEFDEACGKSTNFELIKEKYYFAGYKMPSIVFWNVNGRVGNLPITQKDENVALVSGASPSILKAVLGGKIDPLGVLNNTILTSRYEQIRL
jgi:hypothetical protein